MNLAFENNTDDFIMLTSLGSETYKLSSQLSTKSLTKLIGAYLSEPDLSEAERADLIHIKNKILRSNK